VDTHASKETMTITYKASGRLLNEIDLHSIPLKPNIKSDIRVTIKIVEDKT